jgi:hypothetical protein
VLHFGNREYLRRAAVWRVKAVGHLTAAFKATPLCARYPLILKEKTIGPRPARKSDDKAHRVRNAEEDE